MKELIEEVEKVTPLTNIETVRTLMERVRLVNINDPLYKELVTVLQSKGLS